jgi:hypothetical protein
MKRQRYIAALLLLIGLFMPMVPVMPHHHHNNGVICLMNDVGATSCCEQAPHHHTSDCTHDCCNTGCITTHFFQKQTHAGIDVSAPVMTWMAVLTADPAATLPSRCNEVGERLPDRRSIRLCDSGFVHATGLRAPPSV